ncbi:MAG: hypothetical protein HQL46_16110 [Gammaproteobacteria bacterium]|nr:hypothetical protein [Gammaproteobacteria bacterium]
MKSYKTITPKLKTPKTGFLKKVSGITDKGYLFFISALAIGGTIYIYQDMSKVSADAPASVPAVEIKVHDTASKLAPIETVKVAVPKAKVETQEKVEETTTVNIETTTASAETATATEVEKKQVPTESISPTPAVVSTKAEPVKIEEPTKAIVAIETEAPEVAAEVPTTVATEVPKAPVNETNHMLAPAQHMTNIVPMPVAMKNDMQHHFSQMHRNMPEQVRREIPQQIQQQRDNAESYNQNNYRHEQIRNEQMPSMYDDMRSQARDMHQQMQDDYYARPRPPMPQFEQPRFEQPRFEQPQVHYQDERQRYAPPMYRQPMPWPAAPENPYQR